MHLRTTPRAPEPPALRRRVPRPKCHPERRRYPAAPTCHPERRRYSAGVEGSGPSPRYSHLRSALTITLLLLRLLLLTPFTRAATTDPYFPPPDKEGGWRTPASPTETQHLAGLEPARLESAYALTTRCSQNGGLLVARHGYLAFERYFGRASRNANPDMASTGKAFTSIACGIMLHEFHDKIPNGLDTKVFTQQFLPEAFPLDDPRKSDITLGELLCMTAGYNGEGPAPIAIVHGQASPIPPAPGQNIHDLDQSSIHCRLWTAPGAGYAYSSPSPHVASIVLRHVTGMELQDYIDTRLAKPMGWGPWAYCLHRGNYTMPHANGAGSIALHATDALRFAYCLLHQGKWNDQQLIPPDYIALCNKPIKYNPHCPFTLQFEQNSDTHVPGAPKDAYYKSGAGGFGLFVVPSLDLVIYKLGGNNHQYDPTLTGLPQPAQTNTTRDTWKPTPRTPFNEASLQGDDGLRRVLELVCAACRD